MAWIIGSVVVIGALAWLGRRRTGMTRDAITTNREANYGAIDSQARHGGGGWSI
ncbi:MAG: hypothetical protein U0R80_17870 [Nocardioidaceae bacterium]